METAEGSPLSSRRRTAADESFWKRQGIPELRWVPLSGLRSSEIAGLQWGDVDFNRKFAVVRRSVKNGRISATKTN
jgi:integrase